MDNPGSYEHGSVTLSSMKEEEILYLVNDCDLKNGSAPYIQNMYLKSYYILALNFLSVFSLRNIHITVRSEIKDMAEFNFSRP